MDVTFDAAIDDANRLFQDGKLDEAARQCSQVLARVPGHTAANTLLGIVKLTGGDAEGATRCFRTAIASDPQAFEAHKSLGVALAGAGRLREAVASFRTAIAIKPDYAEAHYDLGVLLMDRGRFSDAVDSLRKATELKPDFAPAYFNLALALSENSELDAAVACYQKVLELTPEFVEAHFNLGIVLGKLNRHSIAIANFQKVIEEMPDLPEAHLNLGVALRLSDYGDAAIESYKKAIELKPDYAEAHNNMGIALANAARLDEAIECYRRAVECDDEYADAHYNLGIAINARRPGGNAAIEHFRTAVSIKPDFVDAQKGLASALAHAGRHREAIEPYQRALEFGGADADLLSDLGMALRSAGQHELAIVSFRDALALKPDHAGAHHGLADVLERLRRYSEAIAICEAALVLNPADTQALDTLANLSRHLCDWRNIKTMNGRLIDIVNARWGGVSPFWFLGAVDDPAAQSTCAEQYWRSQRIPTAAPWRPARGQQTRLRVGYFSRYLINQHATAYLMVELLELHDRAQFEISVFSSGRDDESPLRARVVNAVESCIDVAEESDDAIAAKIRERKIDILVDLDAHTRRNRLAVLARRPAPLQVHYLGYPSTLAVDFIDYMMVDKFVVPPDQQEHFSEQLVYLPHSYQCSDRKRPIAERAPTRAECGLPDDGFVFCCFNNTYKITPDVFDVWMRILQATPKSVLWLLASYEEARDNLRREAAARGVDPARVIFTPNAPGAAHLARYRLADLFLDTLPYNAHTTANDSLWMGVPVLTCTGRAFASRVAGSLLQAAGMPELITGDSGAYEKLAVEIAHNPAHAAALREKLSRNIPSAPLFDTDHLRKSVETAYQRMWEIWRRGESPRSFAVD